MHGEATSGSAAPARYFPVVDEPLRVRPALLRLGHDFGNGPQDAQVFQRDEGSARALAHKATAIRRASSLFAQEHESSRGKVARVLEWMRERLQSEHGVRLVSRGDVVVDADALARVLVEDFVILTREAERDRCALVSVCFPSGWRPAGVLGRSFIEVHAPVPGFDALGKATRPLLSALFERGPYVRFVWSVCPDEELDHHPDRWRAAWSERTGEGYLRVERQVTVPFPALDASLFVIRLSTTAFAQLSAEQRRCLASALEQMPPDMLRYKELTRALPHALRLLG